MKNIIVGLLLFLFVPGTILAQKRIITVSGQVVEQETKETIEAATVQLLALSDSSQVAGIVTRAQGRFVLPRVKAGNYLLKVSFVGYTTFFQPVTLSEKKTSRDLSVIELSADGILLDEAVITAEAPPIVINEDTTEYNASAYRVAAGSMLDELIKQLPGAEIDEDGKITLNGEEIKKIMVNGKEFFGNDTDMSLKNLPADAVQKLKAYKEKSDNERLTGIKDGNETPVLDLTLKKNSGWMGNLSGGYGTEDRYEGNINVNHFTDDINLSFVGAANNTNRQSSGQRTHQSAGITYARKSEKLDIRSNVRYRHNVNDVITETSSETFLGDESTFSNRASNRQNGSHGLNGNARVEWKIDSLNTLNTRINFDYSKGSSWNESRNKRLNNDKEDINETVSAGSGDTNNHGIEGAIAYYHRFRKPGRNFHVSLNFDYSENSRDNFNKSYSQFFMQDSISDIERNTKGEGHNLSWNISARYIEPLSKHYRISVGYTFSNRHGLSQSLVYDSINYADRMNYGYNDNLSSRVENHYGNQRFNLSLQGDHTQWQGERKGLNYNIGIALNPRFTESVTTIGPNTNKDLPRQNVINWSPSVSLDYYFSRRERFTFRYSGQSSAPNMEDLQEVIDVTDPMNLRYGNPNLKSSFSNTVSANYNRYSVTTMRSFRVGVGFNNTMNSVGNRMTYDTRTGARTYHKVNINGNWSSNMNISFDTPFKNKKFTISTGANARYSDQVSYTSVNKKSTDAELSTTHNFSATTRLRGAYRSNKSDIALNASFRYNNVQNNKQKNSNRETFDYTLGGNTNIRLPWDIEFSTDMHWRIREGYSGDANRDEFLWNMQLSKRFMKRKQAMVRVKVYDILRQQNNQSRSVSGTSITDTTTNMLTSYCIVHFVYRFNTLAGSRGGGGRGEGRRRMHNVDEY